MEQHGARICRLAEESTTVEDPESALRTLTQLRSELDEFVRLQVSRGLAAGRSFGELARALGISRQAAHRRYRALAPARRPRRLVATDQARRVVRLAHVEARVTGATAVGSLQLLLGILRTDSDAARALRSEGVTLERIRACGRIADSARDGGDDSGCLRRILKRAGRVALTRGDPRLRPEHLLFAALADTDGGATRTLTALGVRLESIRGRLGL
jgi:ATP-dependent Clp protease ATP-binding subunit ClpA